MDKPFSGPIWLYANMPRNPQAYQKLLQEIMFEGKLDLQFRPEFWSLYADRQQLVIEPSLPLFVLREARPDSRIKIDKLVANNGGNIDELSYVPAMLPNGYFSVILDAKSGAVVEQLMIDPWVH